MKQYIIIALLAGKYVDIPIWLNVCFGMAAFWAVSQINREWE